jgi:hypothetical protein
VTVYPGSAVSAASKTDLIQLLDEVGNAETCELFAAKNFMVHFRLKQETDEIDDFVPVELEGFGEATEEILCSRVYPVYTKAGIDELEACIAEELVKSEKLDTALKSLNAALIKERTRQLDEKKPDISADPDAANLQKVGLDFPKSMAERTVEEHRQIQLLDLPPKTDMVQ